MARIHRGRKPVRVYASGAQDVNHLSEELKTYPGLKPDILDNAYVIIEWEGGVRSSLDLCMFAEASRNQEEICVVSRTSKYVLLPLLRNKTKRKEFSSFTCSFP